LDAVTSTTRNFEIALTFSRNANFRFTIRAGSSYEIHSISKIQHEDEVLLPIGEMFRVRAFQYDPAIRRYIIDVVNVRNNYIDVVGFWVPRFSLPKAKDGVLFFTNESAVLRFLDHYQQDRGVEFFETARREAENFVQKVPEPFPNTQREKYQDIKKNMLTLPVPSKPELLEFERRIFGLFKHDRLRRNASELEWNDMLGMVARFRARELQTHSFRSVVDRYRRDENMFVKLLFPQLWVSSYSTIMCPAKSAPDFPEKVCAVLASSWTEENEDDWTHCGVGI
jgi:hypothetical protein